MGKTAFSITEAVLQIVVSTIIIGPVLWLAGRALVGKQKAKFTDGLWIAALGTIIGIILRFFSLPTILVTIIMIVVWLALIRKFFDCGWLKAIAIGIIAILMLIVIAVILAVIFGIAVLTFI